MSASLRETFQKLGYTHKSMEEQVTAILERGKLMGTLMGLPKSTVESKMKELQDAAQLAVDIFELIEKKGFRGSVVENDALSVLAHGTRPTDQEIKGMISNMIIEIVLREPK